MIWRGKNKSKSVLDFSWNFIGILLFWNRAHGWKVMNALILVILTKSEVFLENLVNYKKYRKTLRYKLVALFSKTFYFYSFLENEVLKKLNY